MGTRKAAAKAAPVTPSAAENDKVLKAAEVESPVSGVGASPVFRADLGESLPPQKPAGVE